MAIEDAHAPLTAGHEPRRLQIATNGPDLPATETVRAPWMATYAPPADSPLVVLLRVAGPMRASEPRPHRPPLTQRVQPRLRMSIAPPTWRTPPVATHVDGPP